jgi:biotin synthase
VLGRKNLLAFRKAGADKAGVAVDLATPELFERYRGSGVGGPHKWDVYWDCLAEALEIFGPGNAGAHLIVGMGETEREMCGAIQRVSDMGGKTHLFSFFPEHGSALEDRRSPPVAQYRRIQMARYLIDRGMADASSFTFAPTGKITDFGIEPELLEQITQSGEPFRTSGCTGHNGEVACNRPYANSRPGPGIRNSPFPPDSADIARIQLQMSLTHP